MSDILRLDLKPTATGQFLAFKDFDSGGALDSALALVEPSDGWMKEGMKEGSPLLREEFKLS